WVRGWAVVGSDGAIASALIVTSSAARSWPILRQLSPPVVVSKTLPGVVMLFTLSKKVARPSNNRCGLLGSITIESLPGNDAKSVTVSPWLSTTVGKPLMAGDHV